MDGYMQYLLPPSPKRMRGNVEEEEDDDDEHDVSSSEEEEEDEVAAAPSPLDMEHYPLERLEEHASSLEEHIRLKAEELHRMRQCIERKKAAEAERVAAAKAAAAEKRRKARKRCSVEGCDKVAKGKAPGSDDPLCLRHGAVVNRWKRPQCNFEGCANTAQAKGGVCYKHSEEHRCTAEGCSGVARRRFGKCDKHCDDDPQKRGSAANRKECIFEGCSSQVRRAGGLCERHKEVKRPPKICEINGCENQARGGGICRRHRKEAEGGVVAAPVPKTECIFPGCQLVPRGAELCNKHKRRKRCRREGCEEFNELSGWCKAHHEEWKERCNVEASKKRKAVLMKEEEEQMRRLVADASAGSVTTAAAKAISCNTPPSATASKATEARSLDSAAAVKTKGGDGVQLSKEDYEQMKRLVLNSL